MRVLVVEDEPDLREVVIDYLGGREGWDAVGAPTIAEAAALHTKAPADAIVLDLALPDGNGADWLRGLRASGDTTPVVIVTARGTESQRIEGLEAGADDYIVKPFSVRELGARVDAVCRRVLGGFRRYRLGEAMIDLERLEVRRGEATDRVSAKEAELLGYLLKRRGLACKREDLLREVWGQEFVSATRTVDTHVFQLRQKIERDPKAPEWIETVHGVGYRIVADE